MLSDDIFKRRRRHNNTPKPVLLIIANYMVCCTLFTIVTTANWFFWTVMVLLGVYNFFTIRRFHEEYNKITIIAYMISLAGLVLLYVVTRKA
jgi:hypothetical protein